VLLVGVLTVRRADAEEPPPTRLEYRVPEACPAVAEFERRVHLRSARIRFLGAGTAPRTLYVEIIANGGAMAGNLRLVESDGTDHRRGFQATSCEDAVEGLALIAAVALDPEGASGFVQSPTPPAPTPPLPPTPPPPKPAALATPETAPPPLVLRRETRLHGDVGGAANGVVGLLPDAVIGPGVFGQIEWKAWRWITPALRVSGMTFPHSYEYGDPGGTATFAVNFLLRLEGCPLGARIAPATVRVCGFFSWAWVESTGRKTQFPRSEVNVMRTLGGSALFSLRMVGPLEGSLGLGVGAALDRYAYAFRSHDPSQPATVVNETPKVGGFAGLGLGLEFP
jgi:hypothetical protein